MKGWKSFQRSLTRPKPSAWLCLGALMLNHPKQKPDTERWVGNKIRLEPLALTVSQMVLILEGVFSRLRLRWSCWRKMVAIYVGLSAVEIGNLRLEGYFRCCACAKIGAPQLSLQEPFEWLFGGRSWSASENKSESARNINNRSTRVIAYWLELIELCKQLSTGVSNNGGSEREEEWEWERKSHCYQLKLLGLVQQAHYCWCARPEDNK